MKRVQRSAQPKPSPSGTSRAPAKVSVRRPQPVVRKTSPVRAKKAAATGKGVSAARPEPAADASSTQPASHGTASPPAKNESGTPTETPAKRTRRGLGTLGMGSLQRHLPTILLAVERPRPLGSPTVTPSPAAFRLEPGGQVALGCVDRTDLLLLRDGLRGLLALLDAPSPTAQEM